MFFDVTPFDMLDGLLTWGLACGALVVGVLLLSILLSFIRRGRKGPRLVFAQIRRLFADLRQSSARRIWALSVLTFRESVRRKALLIFVVFAILFMFAGWFISDANVRPEMQVKIHVSFVLKAITWLILPVMLLLSCWSLPEDIKARSLHTVVTKPIRKQELFLGRILGFTMIGTVMLAAMGAVGYVWITRQVPPEAQSRLICRVPVYGELKFYDGQGNPKDKAVNVGYEWSFRSYIPGGGEARAVWVFNNITKDKMTVNGQLLLESQFEAFRLQKGDQKHGLRCEIEVRNDLRQQSASLLAGSGTYQLSALQAPLRAGNFTSAAQEMKTIAEELSPASGEITLASKTYKVVAKSYRKFATLLKPFQEAQPWTTDLIEAAEDCAKSAKEKKAELLSDSLTSFASKIKEHAGDLKKILVDKIAKIPAFYVQEFRDPHQQRVDAGISYVLNNDTDDLIEGDLFKDLVHGGSLRIAVRCLDRGQYIGMARPDLFIRQPDRYFWVGFAKAIFGIWLMSLLVVILGVTASCFLKGPVASLLTFFLLILGTGIHGFLGDIVEKRVEGVGAVASAIRLVKHLNPKTKIKNVPGAQVIAVVDKGVTLGLWGVHKIIPDFNNFRVIPYIANGYDVPWSAALLPGVMTILGFAFPCLVIGYYSLTLRELEEK